MTLALFDLGGTLLTGDSDLLWTRFLTDAGFVDRRLLERALDLDRRYAAANVVPEAYCNFHASVLAGFSADDLRPLVQRFVADVVLPGVPDAARQLVQRHRESGDRLLLTTATHRVVAQPIADALGLHDCLCTEVEWRQGRCTGRTLGPPNMRAGKLHKLREWMLAQGLPGADLKRATFYSDSFNDLALLSVVGRPVVVDPDNRLRANAIYKGWKVLLLRQPQRVELPA